MLTPHLESQLGTISNTSQAAVASANEESVTGGPVFTAGERLLRSAQCLAALLQSPTARVGLNESRYNVLDALRRNGSEACSQTELATHLLQSESNLSTLLDRMRQAELISRVRSESDRRVALIALTGAGREALARADRARGRSAASVFDVLDERRAAALDDALGLLLDRLERSLGVSRRTTSRGDARGTRRIDAGRSIAPNDQPDGPAASGTRTARSDEGTT